MEKYAIRLSFIGVTMTFHRKKEFASVSSPNTKAMGGLDLSLIPRGYVSYASFLSTTKNSALEQ
jgi:hypothetical protein